MTPGVPVGWGGDANDPATRLAGAVDRMKRAISELDEARSIASVVLAELRAELRHGRDGT